jgi:hypothetical protein
MKLVYTILAEAAEATQNGRLFLLGGEINTIWAPAFPAIHNRLAMVVKFDLEPEDERETPHTIRVDISGLDNPIRMKGADLAFNTPSTEPDASGLPRRALLVLNFPPLLFPMPGKYTLQVIVDGNQVTEVPIQVQEGTVPQ